MLIGENVRSKRLDEGLTQQELAEKLAVNQAYVAKIEKGVKVPSLPLARQLAEVLHCTLDELCGIEMKSEKED